MKKPKISVIMPVCNTPCECLVEAVQSILNQSYKEIELIIIDDGSNSKTKSVLKSFNDNRIIQLSNEHNFGHIYSLNLGLKVASGKYITRASAYDISHKSRFKKQIEFLENNPEIGVLGSAFSFFDNVRKDVFLPEDDEEIKNALARSFSCLFNPAALIRADVLRENDFCYKQGFLHVEDFVLLHELFDKAKFANLSEILVNCQLNNENTSKKYIKLMNLNAQRVMFLNLQKICGKNVAPQLKIIDKMKSGEKISKAEFKTLFEFSDDCEYAREFIKIARAHCNDLLVKLGVIS